MDSPLELEALLRDLDAHGVAVGVLERARLHHLCRLLGDEAGPAASEDAPLRQVLRCTLTKNKAQREAFDAAFERWQQNARWEIERRVQRPIESGWTEDQEEEGVERPCAGLLGWRTLAAGGLILAALIAVLTLAGDPGDPSPQREPRSNAPLKQPRSSGPPTEGGAQGRGTPGQGNEGTEPDDGLPPNLVRRFATWEADPVPVPRSPSVATALLLGFGLLALAGLSRAVFYARARRVPELHDDALGQSALSLPHLAPPAKATPLLPQPALRHMVWNVQHYVSDDLTPRIDLDRTVAATSQNGGHLVLLRERQRYPREIWLWVDGMADRELIERERDEIGQCASAAGLPIKTAMFHGTLETLWWDENQTQFRPETVEGQRQTALVAVLTDGHGLWIQDQGELRRQRLDRKLAGLAQWPRLAFADYGRGAFDLARITSRHGIPCLAPTAVPSWLGGEPGTMDGKLPRLHPGGTPPPLTGARRAWAAGLALTPDSFDFDTALALREALGLSVEARQLERLLEHAVPTGARYGFAPEDRALWCDWLARTDDAAHGFPTEGWLCHGVQFWLDGYRRELARLDGEEVRAGPPAPREPSSERARQRHQREQQRLALRLEIALLQLWRTPDTAAATLERLAASGLATRVRARLETLAPRNARAREEAATRPARGSAEESRLELERRLVRLPWRVGGPATRASWCARPDTVHRLQRLGFGALRRTEFADPRLPRPAAVALALLCGLGGGCLFLPVMRHWWGPRLTAPPPPPAVTVGACAKINVADGRARALLGMPGRLTRVEFNPDLDVDPRWRPVEVENAVPAGGFLVLWRGLDDEPRRVDDPRWTQSAAVIAAPAEDREAVPLAMALLDTGSVDVALVGEAASGPAEAERPFERAESEQIVWIGPTGQTKHALQAWRGAPSLAAVSPDGFGRMAGAFAESLVPLEDLWPKATIEVAAGRPQLRLGLSMVRLQGGRFQMGRDPSDPDTRYGDELPQHAVTVRDFEIGRTEVTRAQYRAVLAAARSHDVPGHQELHRPGWLEKDSGHDLPANELSWLDTVRFCNALSRLVGRAPYYAVHGQGQSATAEPAPDNPDGYRLPSEAEWEFACRAGTLGAYWFGNHGGELSAHAWWFRNSDSGADRSVQRVAHKRPNPWGLFDMHGNVWEWCEDRWHDDYGGAPDNGNAWLAGANAWRVLRGGSFVNDNPGNLRSAYRNRSEPTLRNEYIGFRVVRPARRQ
ncbi:MAG: formylglycine-generating enzyme family protein [Planctomycetota bacterium]